MGHHETADGVLLMAYGAPATLEDVGDFFTHIRGGRRPPPERIADLEERYRRAGDCSTLLRITDQLTGALQRRLDQDPAGPVRVFTGMRHSPPFIQDRVAEIAAAGIRRLVALPLAPHYSSLSIGKYHQVLREAAERHGLRAELILVEDYHDDPGLVSAFAGTLRETLGRIPDDATGGTRVVFTAHSLPERILEAGEPYQDQLIATARLVAGAAGVQEWDFAFQSASPTGEPWLGPDFLDVVRRSAQEGARAVVVAPIGFLADHLEILYDVDVLCREAIEEAGARFFRTPSLNARPDFVEALRSIVRGRLAEGKRGGSGPGAEGGS